VTVVLSTGLHCRTWHDRALIIQVTFMNAEWTSPQLHLSTITVISLMT
jgi:hypothetical protein